MENLNICIDIDGTITDQYYWLARANRYFNKNITPEQVTQYSIDKVMGVSREAYTRFYHQNKFIIHEEEVVRKDAVKFIRKLFDINNIYFVTARDKELEILTYNYLDRYKIPYDGLFVLGSTYKVYTAKKLACDVFIEDSYENALQLSQSGFKVLLVDANYNRQPLDKNIIRVFNWNEIDTIIEKMLLQSKAV